MTKKGINLHTLRLYWQQVRLHKVSFFVMLVAVPVGAMCIDSVLPYFLSEAVGAVSSQDFAAMERFLWIAGAVGLGGALLNFIGFQTMVWHESKVLPRIISDTFHQLIRKDHQFFVDQKIGAITSRFIDYQRAEVKLQDLFVIRTLSFVLSLASGLYILAQQSLLMTAIVLGFVIILVLEIKWSMYYRRDWRHERKTLVGEIYGAVADALANNLIVRTFGGYAVEEKGIDVLNRRHAKIYRKDIGFITAEGSVRVVLMVCVQVGVIVLAASLVRDGGMSLAAAIFTLAYMQRIGSQLFVLSDIILGYDQALLEAQPMTEMLLTDNRVADADDAKELTVGAREIDFVDVSYQYPDGDRAILHHIDTTIKRGQKVGLVGHSGAGKSTVVQLLLRFADVTGGAIKIGGHDIRSVTQASLRRQISYVPQESDMFHRSLRDNIAYGKAGASDEEIIAAAEKANAMEFIDKLPDGLDTVVGERGVKLSGGQRQRIAIARAILENAPILILDEATSALDSASEKLIQASLANLMEGRTAIVIAHRLSTIARLDRIIVLDEGWIVEDGTHEELLSAGGTYAELWHHQSGGFIED
ncbi:hypothetical protein CR983_01875 [Candidatus Saccharibacteria bacterium]|nr:MAG: hypothetical protein CR983_01875 [Candidatus Saccharibacteria bacterium]